MFSNHAKLELQSNLYKTITLATTQKWLSWTGDCLIKHLLQTKSGHSWQGFSFYLYGECFINNKDLLE